MDGRQDKQWYPYAVAACIAVAFYVLLTHLGVVMGAVSTFIGYFKAVILGCVLAYLMNPLAKWYQNGLFRKVRADSTRWTLSVGLTALSVLLLLTALLITLIPQLADSVKTLADNFDDYAASLQALLNQLPLQGTPLDPQGLSSLSENMLDAFSSFVSDNATWILGATASAGKGVFTWGLALILSVYLLCAKTAASAGASRLLRAVLRPKRAQKVTKFFRRCDSILVNFIAQSLLETLIVGASNAVFMLLCHMQYVAIISVVVGVTNLIPTFGPMIGALIGAFILLLVNPVHAGLFLGFICALQFADGYILKPKLFGDSLGVSGLLILIAVIVFGNMFGIIGVLLSIPSAAILNFVYHDYLLTALERQK